MRFLIRTSLLACICLLAFSCKSDEKEPYKPLPPSGPDKEVYFRLNSLGYLKSDFKQAIFGSNLNLEGDTFYIVPFSNPDEHLVQGQIGASRGTKDTPFKFNHVGDFSELEDPGLYRIKLKSGELSQDFRLGAKEDYRNAFYQVMDFFKSQRCGDTDPILHAACHLNDANLVIDASGGWHDAGDYIKYVLTTSFTTVEMLATAECFIDNTPLTKESPEIVRILDEAKVGLDWLLKMTAKYETADYYFQVAGEEDHYIWRMPEEDDSSSDPLYSSRPLHKGWGGNLLGRTSASLALASKLYAEKDPQYAQICLERAEALFSHRDDQDAAGGYLYHRAQQPEPYDYYEEYSWKDDFVLAASELYDATQNSMYASVVDEYFMQMTGDGIDWTNSSFLAWASCYKSNLQGSASKMKMANALKSKKNASNQNTFFLSTSYFWGASAVFTSDFQKAGMYYLLTGDKQYMDMATHQRDYLLGRNNWGVSFVIGVGENYPENCHSQVNNLSALQKGAVVSGPGLRSEWIDILTPYPFSSVELDDDPYAKFQSNVVYFDHVDDYYTNEIALDYTVPSVFMFLYNSL